VPKFRYIGDSNGHKVNMKQFYGFTLDNKGIIDVPLKESRAIEKLKGNSHFEAIKKQIKPKKADITDFIKSPE